MNTNEFLISKTRELIQLNDKETNFECHFKIQSTDEKPYRAVVVSQSQLDLLPEDGKLEMKESIKGQFSGKLIQNTDEKDTWYIALEADENTTVTVNVKVNPIEAYKEVTATADAEAPPETQEKKKKFPMWLIIAIVAIVLLIGWFIIKRFFLSSSSDEPLTMREAPTSDINYLDMSDLPEI